jgi:hypothetical protein
MKAVFADTSFYVALLNARDITHARAVQAGKCLECPVLLTDFIILELGNALSGPGLRKLFTELVSDLRADPNVRIITASRDLLGRGLSLFSDRADKEWSLTDGTSFVAMKEEGLTEALTTDHHFEQAGFTALLR